jgi:hypothetical protein
MVVRVKVGVKGRALPRLLRGSDGLPVYSGHLSSRPERCRRRPRLAGRMIETHGRVKLYDRRADHSQPHQPDHWRSLPDSSHPQELRPREPWPLQRRPPASQQKAEEDESQAEHDPNLRQRCRRPGTTGVIVWCRWPPWQTTSRMARLLGSLWPCGLRNFRSSRPLLIGLLRLDDLSRRPEFLCHNLHPMRFERRIPAEVVGLHHTIPLRNSSSRYLVPRHSIPSFQSVSTVERSSV